MAFIRPIQPTWNRSSTLAAIVEALNHTENKAQIALDQLLVALRSPSRTFASSSCILALPRTGKFGGVYPRKFLPCSYPRSPQYPFTFSLLPRN